MGKSLQTTRNEDLAGSQASLERVILLLPLLAKGASVQGIRCTGGDRVRSAD